MNTKEMIAIMQAHVDGQEIEVRCLKETDFRLAGWKKISELTPIHWNWAANEYRIVTKLDWINWNHVSSEFKYLVRNEDGTALVCKERPEIQMEAGYWKQPYGNCIRVDAFASYQRGNLPWHKSLLERAL